MRIGGGLGERVRRGGGDGERGVLVEQAHGVDAFEAYCGEGDE